MEKPILFSAPMVRAILEGRKTQTRRVVKPQPIPPQNCADRPIDHGGKWAYNGDILTPPHPVGSRIWVRETWATQHDYDSLNPAAIPNTARVHYMATWEGPCGLMKRPSIFMPRWASRLKLEVTDVRVERLWDITASDAIAEGCPGGDNGDRYAAIEQYIAVWESINGPDSWQANPWVWVYTFKVVQP